MTSIIQENISNVDSIVPFGRYKGKPFSMFVSDTNYFNWCIQQPHINKKIQDMYNNTINKTSSNEL